jgi:hypothetical protein
MAGQIWRSLAPVMPAGAVAAAASYALGQADTRPASYAELDPIEFVL